MTITTIGCICDFRADCVTDYGYFEGSSAVLKRSFCHLLQRSKDHAGRSCRDSGVSIRYTRKRPQKQWRRPAQKAYKANIGIGVTGTMEDADPANLEEHPCRGRYILQLNLMERLCLIILNLKQPQPTRLAYKLAVAKEIYDALMDVDCRICGSTLANDPWVSS